MAFMSPTVGIPDRNDGQEIMACVVLKPGSRCTVEELATFSQRELGKYKAPKVIKLVADLPQSPSGKAQRLKLLDMQGRTRQYKTLFS